MSNRLGKRERAQAKAMGLTHSEYKALRASYNPDGARLERAARVKEHMTQRQKDLFALNKGVRKPRRSQSIQWGYSSGHKPGPVRVIKGRQRKQYQTPDGKTVYEM